MCWKKYIFTIPSSVVLKHVPYCSYKRSSVMDIIAAWALTKTCGIVSGSYKSALVIYQINNPDASVGVCCSHKVVAVGFNTLRYDASVGVLNPPHE